VSAGIETVAIWVAITLYAAGAVLFVTGLIFGRSSWTRAALWVSLCGLAPHAVAIGVRWARVGHGPYLGFYEVVSALAFTSVALLGLLAFRDRRLEALGAVIMPLSFLMMGAAVLVPRSDQSMSPTLASWWLVIHIAFAMLAYAAFLASFALASVYLLRERRGRSGGSRLDDVLGRFPSQEDVDDLQFRFAAVGFVLQGIMIVAGAIWANEAWGRYWGWDAIETWSLVSWLVYAAYLHARLALGWRGRRSAWFAVLALPVVVFALVGVPLVYKSIHGAYLEVR
jgi:cytochrome c-type biogenesis protein CcsB